ncbi:putative bifunctional dTTP/UTP pyrophosphatase/methyltransferase protein isoform X2 [Rhinoraja longicauda]
MVLNAVISKLVGKRVVLASASPRRREILNNVCIHGDILEKPANKQDAYNMLSRLSNEEHSVFTGVAIVQCIYKSNNQLETNVTLFHEETKVKFSELSEELLWEYIHSGEPMDKAGGYGIQALGGMLVEYVHGDFLNVVGFPLNHFCKKLAEIISSLECQSTASNAAPCGSVNQARRVAAEKSDQTAPLEEEPKGLGATPQSATSEAREMEVPSSLPRTSSHVEMNECLHKVAGLVDGFKASKVLFTATKLKIFDVLSIQDGLEASDIAQRLDTTVDGTERLLDACVSLGLVDKLPGTSQLYKNTKLANMFLVSGTANSVHDYIIYNNDHIWPLFTHLDSAVKEGPNQCAPGPGAKAADLCQNSEQMSRMAAMNSIIKVVGNDVVRAFDLSSFKTACDLGGVSGVLAYEMANAYHDMDLTLFNLPPLLENIKRSQRQSQNMSRISFQEGNIFTDDIPEADLYILVNVLHYQKEDKIDLLLSKLSQRCKPGCGLLLTEVVLYDRKTKPCKALLQNLGLMMESEGKERSGSEYKKLLHNHRFTNVHIKHTGTLLDVIFCTKQ